MGSKNKKRFYHMGLLWKKSATRDFGELILATAYVTDTDHAQILSKQ